MSDKDRQKKDHERTDKKNKAMRENVSERKQQRQWSKEKTEADDSEDDAPKR